MSGVFGKAKFGGKGRNWFKLKDGANGPFRILPPMGELAEDGRWSAYYQVHYGYKNTEGKMRTFQSPLIKNNKTKMVESPDAALEFIETLTAKLQQAKDAKNGELVTKIQELVGGKKSRYNLDKNHYLNVIDLQGNIGILKLRHRAKLALDAQIKILRDAGTDPLDPATGRFFTFNRSGTAMDTVFSVTPYKKKLFVEGVGDVEQDVIHTITDDLARRCLVVKGTDAQGNSIYEYKEAANLGKLFAKPTSAEVDRIVKEGAKAVDEILDSKTETADSDAEGADEDDAPVQAAVVAAPVPVVAPAPVVSAPIEAVVTAPVVTQAPTVAVATPGPTTVVNTTTADNGAPKTTAQKLEEQSAADFLKDLGITM